MNINLKERVNKVQEISDGKSFLYKSKKYKYCSYTPAKIEIRSEDGDIINIDIFNPIIDEFILNT